MSRFRFYPGAESWPLRRLRAELEAASLAWVKRLHRGSTADSERACVLELAELLGERLKEREGDDPRVHGGLGPEGAR